MIVAVSGWGCRWLPAPDLARGRGLNVDLRTLSLCAGIGGLDLGLRLAIPAARTVCYVEREAFCCELLAQKMETGELDSAPIWTDLVTFDGAAWRGVVDCVIAGYPCQPFSVAGKREGAGDERHLWPEVRRIIREVGPQLVVLENVAGHVRLGLDAVLGDLESPSGPVMARSRCVRRKFES